MLGLTSKMPLAGIVFITMQYLVGLKRLGFDVYYVEAHGKTPWMLMDGQRERRRWSRGVHCGTDAPLRA